VSEYDPIQKAQDATEFAKSRFGQHYLARLTEVRENHYVQARQDRKAGSDSLALGHLDRADEIDGEIAYFAQAKEITESPTLMKRIRESLEKKRKKADD
jgi:hypothetical protein